MSTCLRVKKKIDRVLGRTLVVATIAAGLAWFARGIKESFWRTDQSLHIRWNITNFSDQYERICKLDNESLCHAYVTNFCHEACTLLNYNCKLSPNTSNRVERYYLDWDERIDKQ